VIRVKALVREAKSDFRDVIVMAENPHLHQGVTEARGEAVRALLDPLSHVHRSAVDADLRQFGMWLLPVREIGAGCAAAPWAWGVFAVRAQKNGGRLRGRRQGSRGASPRR
jgi:hypothetical protein